MSKWYGSLNNRLDENQKEIPNIEVGMGVTEYLWSDRHAYEVTKVVNQKDVFIRRYDVKHIGEYGNDEWELISNENNKEMEVVYRYGNWYLKIIYTTESLNKMKENDGCIWLSDDIVNEVNEKGIAYRYEKMNKLRFGVADYYYDFEF